MYRNSKDRNLRVLDATCPLVSKVHAEARQYAARGYTIVLIGHEGHEEVVGTMGEAPDAIQLIGSVGEIEALEVPDPDRVAYITQTTLSVDETLEIIAALRVRFPAVIGPKKDDICYATQNRQNAVKELAREVDLVLVIGSRNSSNSNRLVDVTREMGVASHLIDDETDIDLAWLDGVETVGITSGASAPESLVTRVVEHFQALGTRAGRVTRAGGRGRPLLAAGRAAPGRGRLAVRPQEPPHEAEVAPVGRGDLAVGGRERAADVSTGVLQPARAVKRHHPSQLNGLGV